MMVRVVDEPILRRRLEKIGGGWLAERLTPPLAAYCGEAMAPEGINLIVELALFDLIEAAGLPEPAAIALQLRADEIKASLPERTEVTTE